MVWSSPDSQPCEYFNFGILYEFSDQDRPSELTNEETLRDVEEIFSRELQAVGFHRAANDEKPWLFLRAVHQKSFLRSNAITGGVQFASTPSLHRDYLFARGYDAVPLGNLGMMCEFPAITV